MLKIVNAILIVLVVIAVGGLVHLPAHAVRAARAKLRRAPAPARLAAH